MRIFILICPIDLSLELFVRGDYYCSPMFVRAVRLTEKVLDHDLAIGELTLKLLMIQSTGCHRGSE